MLRKVAYVFLYKNGIRERSVGILKRYGRPEQPEVALELFGKELQRKTWSIFYFTKDEALKEASCLWEDIPGPGSCEGRSVLCRLCAEAGDGGGIVLLPTETGQGKEEVSLCSKPEEIISKGELREYLCARYDGKEITEARLREAASRKPALFNGENPCIESAKKLMEEIAKAAGGETEEEHEERTASAKEQSLSCHKKLSRSLVTGPEKIMQTNPGYMPGGRGWPAYSVRVAPEDLRELSEERGAYAENSYLLHAYYRYRHVLLGRRRRKDEEEYVVMIPGIYNEREAGLAKMFGFPEFLPVTRGRSETDRAASGNAGFGYFCGKI